MGKQGILMLVLGLAIGANLVLAAWVIESSTSPQTALGQGATVDGNGRWTLATGTLAGQGNASALFIWDGEDKKLTTYFVKGQTLKLLHVRDCTDEMAVKAFGNQDPAYGKMPRKKN